MAVITSVEASSSAPKATQPVRTRRRKLHPSPLCGRPCGGRSRWWQRSSPHGGPSRSSSSSSPTSCRHAADTWRTTVDNSTYLLENTWVTTYETVVGFVIAALIGEAVALVMIYSRGIERTMYPLILFAQVIPKIAIAPLFIVWLGFGTSPKILVAVLMAFFPIVVSGMAGLRSVDPEILELTSTMGASNWKTFVKVRFPASLPQLMSGLKIAATLAVTGAVVGEFVGANEGLGYVILQANGNIDTAMLFAALIIMSMLGIILFAIIEIAEQFLIPWHASRRSTASVVGGA